VGFLLPVCKEEKRINTEKQEKWPINWPKESNEMTT